MFITIYWAYSKIIHRLDAAQQCAEPILHARQAGVCRMEWTIEMIGIVMLGSVGLYMLQQIGDSLR